MKQDTITAISTPIGVGGISIVRISGDKSLDIISKIFSSKKTKNGFIPRYFYLGEIDLDEVKEKCMVVYFKAPYSYTGEDLVEIQCHGGMVVTQKILEKVCSMGARLAEGGEFTKRGFLNGKISLDEAEGVMDIISAESESELKAGYNLMNGNLLKEVKALQKKITDALAYIEVTFDYPENDIEETTTKQVEELMCDVKNKIETLINSSNTGIKLKQGYRVLILGKPNVGKSSLMNAMLNYDRAIVTNIHGTTRDILEETYIYNGVKFVLTDTAGVRNADDEVEQIGILKAKQSVDYADIILAVFDNNSPIDNLDSDILKLITDKNYIIIVNKCDLNSNLVLPDFVDKNNIMYISAQQKQGVEELKKRVYDNLIDKKVINSNVVITNTRHLNILRKALVNVEEVMKSISDLNQLELVSIDLKNLWLTLGEITGESNNEEIISSIFANFCVGK